VKLTTGSHRAPATDSTKNLVAKVLLALLVPVTLLAADPPPPSVVVWDFEQGIGNAWDGHYNAYMREPSWARTYLDPNVKPASSGHALRVTAHREVEGFCGVWMEFYPRDEAPRRYLDASPYRFLSFWIRGQKGGEEFELQLVDDAPEADEEARPKRPLRAYLSQGATTEWQEVLIPLADFHGLNLRRLARLTLHFTTPGDYRFYLDEIAFKRAASTTAARHTVTPEAPANPAGNGQRAMWVWNTKTLFDPALPEEVNRFFEFCAQQGIREIYLALEFDRRVTDDALQFDLRTPERYREFLARAHQKGLTVEGLAGTPEWAVRENHAHALAAVDAALTFNRASPSGARLDGVHFDVEPYLLVGYSDPEYRTQILGDFLDMVSQCAARVRTEPGLRFSCDVPAWFYPAGGLERQRLTVTFQGKEKTVGEHLTDMLDSVTIMDYHNQADGAGGIIARGIPSVQYAAAQGKRIVVGLETFAEAESTICFVCGLPAEEFRQRLAASGLRNRLFLDDFRMSVFSDDVNLHIGISARGELTEVRREALEGALVRLARKLGASSDPQRFPVAPILEEARAALAENRDWQGFETFQITDPETQRPVMGFRAVHRMSPRTTFHGLGREVFAEESRSVVEWLGRYPSFAGLAIHFYDSFRSLMEGK